MILTQEQVEIIQVAKTLKINETLKINAFAGTGKTTTLIAITNEIIDKRFLYLAFNNDIVSDAKKKFKNNVFATTVNGLAYRKIVMENKYKIFLNGFKAIDVSELLNVSIEDAHDILKIYTYFCNSNAKEINSDEVRYYPKRVTSWDYAKEFYQLIKNKKIECDHSFYLKEYELQGFARELKYDYVLLDEAQDTNPVTLSIFNQIESRKILVGDTHQTIYQFRDSVNAMKVVSSEHTLYLTTTYRCNKEIVNIANIVLGKFKNENKKLQSGVVNQDKNISNVAYISRTNFELISLINSLESFNLMKGVDDVFGLSKAVHQLFVGKQIKQEKYSFLNKIKDNVEKKYSNKNINQEQLLKLIKEELKSYSEKINDIELQGAIRNANMFKGYLYVLENKAKQKHSSKSNHILITGHSSKGLEFDKVVVCKDFKNPCEYDEKDFIAEANLLYVVVTRAKKEISFANEGLLDDLIY